MTPHAVLAWWGPNPPSVRITSRRGAVGSIGPPGQLTGRRPWSPKGSRPRGADRGRRDIRLVPHTGFEPVISALRGRRPGPLDECGRAVRTDPSEPRPGHDATRAAVALANPGGALRALRIGAAVPTGD